ncbi:hypothetical protein JCM3774_005229 [Rhodotorula dairenensis]
MDEHAASPPPAALYRNAVPFKHFATLIHQLGGVKARPAGLSRAHTGSRTIPNALRAFIRTGRQALGTDGGADGIVVLFFRLFFPDEGMRRRYDLREQALSHVLAKLLGIRDGRLDNCITTSQTGVVEHAGCLGEQIRLCMAATGRRVKGNSRGEELTLGRVDQLLDELAALSQWSAKDVRDLRVASGGAPRTQSAILADLLQGLAPSEVSVMVQIVLRDLSPLLYPPPTSNPTAVLLQYNTNAYTVVSIEDALAIWAPGARSLYCAVADLDRVAWAVDVHLRSALPLPPSKPCIGVPVKIPKSQRPGTCRAATKDLKGPVAVESKYDGERVQLHIDLSRPPGAQIRIFSKSGRDSTHDRRRLLPAIKASLRIPADPPDGRLDEPLSLQHSSDISRQAAPLKAILEGEMVPWDESRQEIAEFWRLGYAKLDAVDEHDQSDILHVGNHTALIAESYDTGQTGATPSPRRSKGSQERDHPTPTGHARHNSLRLMIVWFDCLLVGNRSLLDEPYERRREALRCLVSEVPGYSMVAEQEVIDFSHRDSALPALRERFAQIIVDRCEGLMLKPLSSRYNDSHRGAKWIKLKKDFIPGAGDTLDFYLVGASYNIRRARELLVPPSVLTTFFVGLEAPEHGLQRHARENKRHFHILFAVSYGMSREELAWFNSSIRQTPCDRFEYPQAHCAESPFACLGMSGPNDGYQVYDGTCTSFTFSFAKHLRGNAVRPQLIFRQPRVAELNGAGFQKSPESPYYELRWPRFVKADRSDGEPVNLSALQRVAEHAVGTEPPAVLRLVEQLFDVGMDCIRSRNQRDSSELDRSAQERAMWVRRLEEADGAEHPNAEASILQRRNTAAVIVPEASTFRGRGSLLLTSTRPPVEGRRRLTQLSSLPITAICRACPTTAAGKADMGHQEASRPTTPTRNSTGSPMKRSYSSPGRRSDAPSPSQRGLDGPLPTATSFASAEAGLRAQKHDTAVAIGRCKRVRITESEQGGHADRALRLRATLPTLLPSFCRSRAARPGAAARSLSDPTASSVWTMVPPPPAGPERTPCHASLDRSNYVLSPLEVLRAAGHVVQPDPELESLPTTAAAAAAARPASPPRMGYIFVAEDYERDFLTTWRKERNAQKGREPGQATQAVPKPVFVLTMDAFRRGFSLASAHARRSLLASA